MIEMLFSLRFQAQLRRTRGALYQNLEDTLVGALKASGGNVTLERRHIGASFDEGVLGFWIDMLTVLRSFKACLDEVQSELYGYTVLIGRNLSDGGAKLIRSLPSGGEEGRFWADAETRRGLRPFVSFDEVTSGGFAVLREFYRQGGEPPAAEDANAEAIRKVLRQGGKEGTLLVGRRFSGKRRVLRSYSGDLLKGNPPLVISFGEGGRGLSCLTDALSEPIRGLIGSLKEKGVLEELEELERICFKERFRDQYSPHLLQVMERFLILLLSAYGKVISMKALKPILILENIDLAEENTGRVFTSFCQSYRLMRNFTVYGSCQENFCVPSGGRERAREPWAFLFPHVARVSGLEWEGDTSLDNLGGDLLEMAYTFSLLNRYYPQSLFPQLLEEEGRNPRIAGETLGILQARRLIDLPSSACIRISGFNEKAEALLGEGKEKARRLVSSRLLSWVNSGRFKPCFNLLKALSSLGGQGSDELILDSIAGDINNSVYAALERAVEDGSFAQVVGEGRHQELRYIFHTRKALIHGSEGEIREAFSLKAPDTREFPVYRAQILSDLTRYYLGIQDLEAAAETVKEAMMLSQNQKGERGLAQAYRLFALVNISRNHTADALDYLTFAVENDERSGNDNELALSCYYAAAAHFLFGNLARSEKLARKGEQAALAAGRSAWEERTRFLRGRLRFETGRYQDAREIFQSLLSAHPEESSPGPGNKEALLQAWIYRCDVFLEVLRPRLPRIPSSEAALFEIEAAYLGGRFDKAWELSELVSPTLDAPSFLFIEQPDWSSGFSQCEFLVFPRPDFLRRILTVYRCLARSRLASPEKGADMEALEQMRSLIRGQGISSIPQDPHDAFYYYAWYCVLGDSGQAEVDMNTAISVAFKKLQSRASRIDDVETKRAYLNLNLWNRALGEAAKKHKLI